MNVLSSELLVDAGEGVKLVLEGGGILLVEEDLDELGTINSLTGTLAGDLGRENEVFEDLLVNLLEGTGTGSLLLDAGATGGLAHHAALTDEDDVTVGELLLELTSETTLDLVESLDLGDGDEDNDGLLSSLDVDLAGSGDLERAELSLEIGNVVLEVEEGLGDQRLGGIGSGAGRVGGPEDLGGSGLKTMDRTWRELSVTPF